MITRRNVLIAAAFSPVVAIAQQQVRVWRVGVLSSRPDNITGITNINPELSAKRLEVLKEIFPKVSRVAVFDSGAATSAVPHGRRVQFEALQRVANSSNIQLVPIDIAERQAADQKLTELRQSRADAIYVMGTPGNVSNRRLLVDVAARARLPASYPDSEFAEAGGLMSYGPDREALYRRAAVFVDRILRGAKPADLPVELPTHFELVINMQTVKRLGISIPPAIVVRANRIIE